MSNYIGKRTALRILAGDGDSAENSAEANEIYRELKNNGEKRNNSQSSIRVVGDLRLCQEVFNQFYSGKISLYRLDRIKHRPEAGFIKDYYRMYLNP